MGKNHPGSLSPRDVERILRQAGATEAPHGGKGDHAKWHYWIGDHRFPITVDQAKEIPEGTLRNIAKQAQLSMDEFWALYRDPKRRIDRSGLAKSEAAD